MIADDVSCLRAHQLPQAGTSRNLCSLSRCDRDKLLYIIARLPRLSSTSSIQYNTPPTTTTQLPPPPITTPLLPPHTQLPHPTTTTMPHKISLCAGPSEKRGTLKDLAPNPPPTLPPTAISPSLRVRVHIKNWSGTPVPLTAGDHYFKDPSHTSDHFSIQFFFTPPHDIPGDELVLCNTFSSPIRSKLPIFFGAAWAALLWVDPGIGGDPYTDSPEIYSRVLSAVNFMDVHGEVTGEEEEMGPVVEEHMPASIPAIPAKRKKFFLDARNQVKFTFKKGVEYRWDFCNGMMDFSGLSLLPFLPPLFPDRC